MDQFNPPTKQVLSAIASTIQQFDSIVPAFDALLNDLVLRMQEERKERRATITKEADSTKKRRFSPNVLTYRFYKGTFELSWVEIFRKRGNPEPFYRRIPLKKGVTHINKVLKGSLADEVDLLREHEFLAREHRELWTDYIALRRAMRQFQASAEKLVGEPKDPPSA